MITHPVQTIGKLEKNYGYLIGLGIDEQFTDELSTLYAVFETSYGRTVWIVPDFFLFDLLLSALRSMALGGDCETMGGLRPLVISNEKNEWHVEYYCS